MAQHLKRYRHSCGYVLQSGVLGVVGDKVVVNYFDRSLVVYLCPRCRKSLQLWWDDPAGRVIERSH